VADAVSGFANLIIIGSSAVTANTTELTNVCNYLYQKGFYFIVYVGSGNVSYLVPQGPDSSFFQMAINCWGEQFLGAYIFDESGGKQLDLPLNNLDKPVPVANDSSDAALHYTLNMESYLYLYQDVYYSVPQMKLFTSDYGLYWYDYLSGYDVVFTEFVGNQSRQLAVSLDRGAAESQGKNWGAIITVSPQFPTIENATQLYSDMTLAWENNAKYIVVFDGAGPNGAATTTYGSLTTQHLNAMKNFWDYTKDHQQPHQDPAQTAYVLPEDYGCGFRGPNDTIWGLFPADSLSAEIWNESDSLLATYGMKLDIVYETRTDSIPINLPYKTLIFWNGTTTVQP
jgi:hypothetical protein